MLSKIKNMFKRKDSLYTIKFSFLMLLVYTIFIILNDYICFFAGTHANVYTYIGSIAILMPIMLILRRSVKIDFSNFSKYDLIFLVIIGIIYLLKFAIPDSAFDTLNYHLYEQENCFSNNVSFNYFPARWINTFSIPLADRMHYFFRFLLGYRLGYILNLFIVIVIYYQTKQIIQCFIQESKFKYIIPILAILVVLTDFVLQNFVTYYVDLFAIPFFLEIIIIMLKKDFNKFNIMLVIICAGIALALKISNAFLLIPLGITFLILAKKNLKWYIILIGAVLIICPIAVYFLNNYIQTGNPVYPFYNTIFKSKFLDIINWKEEFYGPKRIRERLLWPIYTLISPRRANDSEMYAGRLGFGYIATIIMVIYSIIKKDKKKIICSSMLIVLYLTWSNFMMGYIRYALVLDILSGIAIIVTAYYLLKEKAFIYHVLGIVASICLLFEVYNSTNTIVYTSNELSWRANYFKDKEIYRLNMKETFVKRDYTEYLKDVDCFGIADYNSGYAVLLSNEIPSINLLESYSNEYGKEKYEEFIKEYEDKNMYVISTTKTIERTLNYLEKTDFDFDGEIKEFKADFLDITNNIVLLKVKHK